MLCDDFTSEAGHRPILAHYHAKIASMVSSAQKFVIDDNLAVAIDQVSKWRPSSMMNATEYARAPYDLSWLEWSSSATPPEDTGCAWNQLPTSRVGMLIKCGQIPLTGTAWLVWKNRNVTFGLATNVSPLRLEFDFRCDGRKLGPGYNPCDLSDLPGMVLSGQAKFAIREEAERAAHIAQSRQIRLELDDTIDGMFFRTVLKMTNPASDWGGEWQFMKSALIMLNSRNGTTSEGSDLSRLNRSRERKGKLPLFEYKILKLRIGNVRGHASSSETTLSGCDKRVHLVRGHYKVRATGVFWWAPYARGRSSAGVIVKRYSVGVL